MLVEYLSDTESSVVHEHDIGKTDSDGTTFTADPLAPSSGVPIVLHKYHKIRIRLPYPTSKWVPKHNKMNWKIIPETFNRHIVAYPYLNRKIKSEYRIDFFFFNGLLKFPLSQSSLSPSPLPFLWTQNITQLYFLVHISKLTFLKLKLFFFF